MSRTYKDKPYKIRYPREHRDDYVIYKEEHYLQTEQFDYFDRKTLKSVYKPLPFPVWRYRKWEIPGPTTKPKIRRFEKHKDYNWYKRTPSWWTRLFMNKPQRKAGRMWERRVLFQDLEETDPPGVSRKPHKYYW